MNEERVVLTDKEWAFIPGPETFQEPLYSVDMDEIAEILPEEFSSVLLALDGWKEVHPALLTWWEWKARWESDSNLIELEMSLFEEPRELWGGSIIEADCRLVDILATWESLRGTLPGVWIHAPDNRVLSPTVFASEYAY